VSGKKSGIAPQPSDGQSWARRPEMNPAASAMMNRYIGRRLVGGHSRRQTKPAPIVARQSRLIVPARTAVVGM
jgi:hypothetical protein